MKQSWRETTKLRLPGCIFKDEIELLDTAIDEMISFESWEHLYPVDQAFQFEWGDHCVMAFVRDGELIALADL